MEGTYGSRPTDAPEDLEDLRSSEALVILPRRWSVGADASGGRHVEFGYALRMQIPIVVLGRGTNPFYDLPGIGHVHWIESSVVSDREIDQMAQEILASLRDLTEPQD